MRRLLSLAILLLTIALAAPSDAHAGWLGYVARLSGPGPFGGYWAFRVQVLCFMESTNQASLIGDAGRAYALTDAAMTAVSDPARSNAPNRVDVANLRAAYTTARTATDAAALTPTLGARQAAANAAQAVVAQYDAIINQLPLATNPSVMQTVVSGRDAWAVTQHTAAKLNAPRTILTPGLIVNANCDDLGGKVSSTAWRVAKREDLRPRASLLVDYRQLKTLDPNPDYAQNNQIRMDVVLPRFSLRVFSNPTYDALHLQAGLGVAMFSSEGFDGFSKLIVEPIRWEIRVPSRFTSSNTWTSKLLRMPSYGVGFTMFPQGFSADDFNGTGLGARNIQGKEGVLEQSFVLNLGPLLGL